MEQVTRIMHRRADPGREKDYEELARGMLEACSRAKGYLFSTLIPPRVEGEEFHVVQTFASQADLDTWRQSRAAHEWHERINEVCAHTPEYRTFNTADLWFSTTGLTVNNQPPRWRMAIVIWMGIFPIASFYIWFLFPVLEPVPFIPRMVIFTALIVITMFFGALPYLLRWMGWFLHK
ncbi:antibiotic biosynthesis monooxygenase protein (plasmid) [Rhizobium etli 8C-3]|uniref:Antibiotic biosynthesis monooxygenase protein n=1 Tax=Rhizobium etli 8C-3 TaxID=538025 RepID=A0A1L5PDM0_RHIET|nr:antibiotic biosynthesis monooxygenase [Rhizobium etli]APO78279.1 antibiotic biosynthesis monooxygenase protein [Rhizobium etli 8C-3]